MKSTKIKILIFMIFVFTACTSISRTKLMYPTKKVIDNNIRNVEVITKNGDKYEFPDSNFVFDSTSGAIKGITRAGEKVSLTNKDVNSYEVFDERLITEKDKILTVVLKNGEQVLFDKYGGKLDSRNLWITGHVQDKSKKEINHFTKQMIPLEETKRIVFERERDESINLTIYIIIVLALIFIIVPIVYLCGFFGFFGINF